MNLPLLLLVMPLGACDNAAATLDSQPLDAGVRDGRPADLVTSIEAQPGEVGPDVSVLVDGSPALDAPTCSTPTPFVPPGPTTPWNKLSSSLVVLAGAANHRAQDVVVLEGAPQVLIGKFAYGVTDTDLIGEDVEIFVQQSPPCGDWISLGSAVTSAKDQYGTQYGIQDDGGRIFFTIPPQLALGVGRYPVRMLVKGDHSEAAMILHVVRADTSTVVFDIDGTLTTDDFQLVAELVSQLLSGSYDPAIQPGALEVTSSWADKGYLLVYLTGRPEQLHAQTLSWLKSQGFPPGALMLTNTLDEALTGVAAFKTNVLQTLASATKLELYAAYGNATTDIEAYAAAGIDKSHTYIIGANGGTQSTVAVDSYANHLPAAQAAPAATVAAPPPVGW